MSFSSRPRGVLGGLVVVAAGVPFLLQAAGVPNSSAYLFLTLGGAFAAAYVRGRRQYVYLVPAATLVAFGVALLLPTWLRVPPNPTLFLVSLAAALTLVWMLAPDRRWPLLPAAALALIAGADVLARIALVPAALQPYFVPFVLIAIGWYLLVEPQS